MYVGFADFFLTELRKLATLLDYKSKIFLIYEIEPHVLM